MKAWAQGAELHLCEEHVGRYAPTGRHVQTVGTFAGSRRCTSTEPVGSFGDANLPRRRDQVFHFSIPPTTLD